jgi:MarR family transcriptional repressor of emrRAB
MCNDTPERLANLMGALALGIADRVRLAISEQASLGGETLAALVAIGHAPGLSIGQLSHVLRLSHPGTVRVVDRLEDASFLKRWPSPHDRRAVALHLTAAGEAERTAVLERRQLAIKAVMKEVPIEDLPVLERLAETMLAAMPHDATTALTVCRYCNERQCPACPMDKFGELVIPDKTAVEPAAASPTAH